MSKLDYAYDKYVKSPAAFLLTVDGETIERCIVDDLSRHITVPESLKIAGVEADNNVKRIFFKTDREAQIVDLSKLDIYINYPNAKGEADRYHCDDKKVEGDFITFSWLVSDFATKYKGKIKFIVCMENENGEHWNSTIAELEVLEGLETKETVIEQNPSVLENILLRLEEVEESQGISIDSITNEEIDAMLSEGGA